MQLWTPDEERQYYARHGLLPPLDTEEEYADWYRLSRRAVAVGGRGFSRKGDRERWYRLALKREARGTFNATREGLVDVAYSGAVRACGIAADLLSFRLDGPDHPELEIGDVWPEGWQRDRDGRGPALG